MAVVVVEAALSVAVAAFTAVLLVLLLLDAVLPPRTERKEGAVDKAKPLDDAEVVRWRGTKAEQEVGETETAATVAAKLKEGNFIAAGLAGAAGRMLQDKVKRKDGLYRERMLDV